MQKFKSAALYFYLVAGTALLVFVTGQGTFIRPMDDAKELFFYAWLAVISLLILCAPVLKNLSVPKRREAHVVLQRSVVIYLVYILNTRIAILSFR
jgi:hypothetical protein